MSVSGNIRNNGYGQHRWRIENFLSVSCVKSPSFFFEDIGLFLEVSIFKREDSLQVAVYNTNILSGKSSRDLHIELSMNTGGNGNEEKRSGTLGGSGKLHFFRWMPWTEMLHRRLEILYNGCLGITCNVKEISPTVPSPRTSLATSKPESETEVDENKSKQFITQKDENEESDESSDQEAYPQSKGVKNLLKALRRMLTSGEDSDVIINVQGKEFRAHRGILRARSTVFSSMFSHDMLEKNSGVVKIHDCDPEIFPYFLDHIYTGNTNVISKKNVFCLYEASDKYDVGTLKEECVEFMKENMAVDSFCNTITLAVKHDEKELIEVATEFFCANSRSIIQTVEWQTFLTENAIVGNELFIKLLSK